MSDKILLHYVSPEAGDQTLEIGKASFSIGRGPDNDLTLADSKISRNHLRLLLEDDQVMVIDLNSSNGTIVGEARLAPNEPYRLAEGEKVQIGAYQLYYERPVVEDKAPKTRRPPAKKEPEPEDEPVIQLGAEPVEPAEKPKSTQRKPKAKPVQPEEQEKEEVQLGAVAVGPPPPPPELPAWAENGFAADLERFGLHRERSRYLDYLPPIFGEDPFLGRFLLGFESLLSPIEQIVDHFDLYLDPATAPPFFLDQLASWLGMALDEKWPLEKRRAVLAEAADLYRRRGTRAGLSRYLEIYAEVSPEISEPKGQAHHFEVKIKAPKGVRLDRATIERIIEANKPAHTTFELEISR